MCVFVWMFIYIYYNIYILHGVYVSLEVCESCIEPVPECSEEELLAVDLSTAQYCCPHYHCGKFCFGLHILE